MICKPLRSTHGFTLFELILAISLLAMISVMVYSVVNVGIRFVEKGQKKIETIEKEQGLITLIHRQVSSAYYSSLNRRVMISGDDGEVFRLVTRSPLINRDAGVVLAVYRFDKGENKLYYLEKKDFYNIDYDEEYVPDINDMFLLLETTKPISIAYSPEDAVVTVEYGDNTYEFEPRSVMRNM